MSKFTEFKNPELKRFFEKNFNSVIPVPADTKAAKTIGTSTSVITLTSKLKGAAGNAFNISLVEPDDNGTLALAFNAATQTLVVTLAKSGGSITTTGALLEAAIDADTLVNKFVDASAGGVDVMAATAKPVFLEGGIDGNLDAEEAFVTVGGGTSVVTLTSGIKGAFGNKFNINLVALEGAANDLSIEYKPLSMSIIVTLAKSGGSVTTTGALLEAAINDNESPLKNIITASAGGGSVMAATAKPVSFYGGVNGTPGIGGFTTLFSSDGNNMYVCSKTTTVNGSGNWRKFVKDS